jgi:hypothetical protein
MDMKIKCAFIEATLPELKGGKMYQVGRGEGTNAPAAISRAVKDMLKKVKGKRVSIITARIVLTTKANNEVQRITEEPNEAQV